MTLTPEEKKRQEELTNVHISTIQKSAMKGMFKSCLAIPVVLGALVALFVVGAIIF